MNNPVTEQIQLQRGRIRRFIVSAILISLAGIAVSNTASSAGESNLLFAISFAIYAIYIVVQAALLIVLTGTLFKQHEMRASKFGVGAMLIIMTMIALPFGFATMFEQAYETFAAPPADPNSAAPLTGQRMPAGLAAFVLFLVLIPLLPFCEAIMHWLRERRKAIGSA